jgi:hypothetical protein
LWNARPEKLYHHVPVIRSHKYHSIPEPLGSLELELQS